MDLQETVETTKNHIAALNHFLTTWDDAYKQELLKIDLFNVERTKDWSTQQKQRFTKIFYHIRGHFHDFLWHMGNYAPNAEAKQMILQNIGDEFGVNGRSHEQLYLDFAACVGVDLNEEISSEKHYLPFVRDFNKGHLEWLRTHSWEDNLIFFSAYERLDNIDYTSLYNLTESFGLTKKELVFFSVHKYVKHFDNTLDYLYNTWLKDPIKTKMCFDFIARHQMNMWKMLSDEIYNYENNHNIRED